LTFWDYIV